MSLDAMNERPDELSMLRQRVDRLEREMAELRGVGIAADRTHLGHDEAVTEVGHLAFVESHLGHDEVVAKVGHPIVPPPPPLVKAVPPAPRASLESRLGSQIFNRIAIVALLIGTAYGLKLAIDNGLIGPVARVLIGLVAGAGLVLWSERFRRQGVKAFSYSLKAVDSGVLYLTLWAAFQLFHMMPAGAALAAMLLVTAWNAFMAWTQDAELLAAYALIGGFLTPVLLSTGGNHEVFLFTYVLALDLATVLLIRLKGWPRLLLGTFPATVVYFAGWFFDSYHADELGITAFFLVLFWAVFAWASLGVGNEGRKTSPLVSVLLPLGNAGLLAVGMFAMLWGRAEAAWLPWLMLLLAGAYLGLMRLPQRKVVSAIHLSLAIVFLTIAIPLKASGHGITVAWLVEGLALYWVSTRLGAPEEREEPWSERWVLRGLSAGALTLGFVAVCSSRYWWTPWMDERYSREIATVVIGIAAFAGVAWIAFRQGKQGKRNELAGALIAADLLAVLLCARELGLGRDEYMPRYGHADLVSSLLGLVMLAGSAWAALQLRRREPEHGLWTKLAGASVIAFNLLAVLTGVRMIADLWTRGTTAPNDHLKEALAISAFLMVYSAGLLAVGFWKRSAFVRWQGLALMVFTIAKTFLFDIGSLSQGYRVASLMGLGVLLMGVSYAYQKDWLGLKEAAVVEKELP